jgi:hypothetical protein
VLCSALYSASRFQNQCCSVSSGHNQDTTTNGVEGDAWAAALYAFQFTDANDGRIHQAIKLRHAHCPGV